VTVVFEVLAAALVLFLAAAAATGRLSGLADAQVDRTDTSLPEGRLSATEIDGTTFTMAFRGYRMEEVDAALDKVVAELKARETEGAVKDETIAALTRELDAAKGSAHASSAARSSAPVASFTPQPVAPPTIAPPQEDQ
jgi:DivIVA domain-containing protein